MLDNFYMFGVSINVFYLIIKLLFLTFLIFLPFTRSCYIILETLNILSAVLRHEIRQKRICTNEMHFLLILLHFVHVVTRKKKRKKSTITLGKKSVENAFQFPNVFFIDLSIVCWNT